MLPSCLLLLLLLLGVARGAGQLPCHSLGAINNVPRQPALTGPRCKNKPGARPWALPLPSQVGHGPIRGFFRAGLGFCCAEPGSRLGQACNRDANVHFGFILYFFGAVLAFVPQLQAAGCTENAGKWPKSHFLGTKPIQEGLKEKQLCSNDPFWKSDRPLGQAGAGFAVTSPQPQQDELMLRHGATLVLLQPSLPGRNPNSCSQHHVLVSAGSGGASPVRGRGAQQLLPVLCLWLVPLGAALIPCVRTASGCSCGQDLPFFFFFAGSQKSRLVRVFWELGLQGFPDVEGRKGKKEKKD